MKKSAIRLLAAAGAGLLVLGSMSGCGSREAEDRPRVEEKFIPSLNTEKQVDLDIAGYISNFEALDQVVNDFNDYYPNVTIRYEKCTAEKVREYLENNKNNDIFMTGDSNLRAEESSDIYVLDYCLNLSDENIDVSAIDPDLLSACSIEGHLVRIPLSRTMCGMVVNETLLEKEGLEIPRNYGEFIKVCEILKKKGYTPIQSARNHVCSDLILPMALTILGNSEILTDKANAGALGYVEELRPIYEKLYYIIENGYMLDEVNAEYPNDNYDGAILKFFEGDVPFWICNTESFSGMKKRESKSETYTASPFRYSFRNVPLGDEGSYDYEEPWNGFSINKESDAIEYAVEFIRFLCLEQEIDKLAEIKGMPSVSNSNRDERFSGAINADNVVDRYVYDGRLDNAVNAKICAAGNRLGTGTLKSVEEALAIFRE